MAYLHDNLYIGNDPRLVQGIKRTAEAVGVTMGTGGNNSILECIESPGHMVTNDGYTIANAIKFADPIEEMGRKILVESINRANKASGDGSSTTCVLTAAIIEAGLEHLGEVHPMEIKRSLEACIQFIEESIAKQKRDIGVDEIFEVAAISAEDADIGARIGEIYQKIGKSGIIYWDVSKSPNDTYTIGTGLTLEGGGYLSPYLCDVDEKTGNTLSGVRWSKPTIVVTKQKISSAAEFEGLFKALYERDVREVIVFADDIDVLVVSDLVKTRVMRGFKTMVVKMPVLWREQWYEDLALASGATLIDPAVGLRLKDAKPEHCGTFGHVIVGKEDTYIDGIKDLTAHIAALEASDTDDAKQRAARLNTKTARYYVGGHSDSAISYRRLKVEDAIAAAYHALNGGIVAGGGVALRNVAVQLLDKPDVGAQILANALAVPMHQILTNAGLPTDIPLEESTMGYDTSVGLKVDMFEAGIVDPVTIVLNCVRNAISVAASVLTANTIVTLPREEPLYPANKPLML